MIVQARVAYKELRDKLTVESDEIYSKRVAEGYKRPGLGIGVTEMVLEEALEKFDELSNNEDASDTDYLISAIVLSLAVSDWYTRTKDSTECPQYGQ